MKTAPLPGAPPRARRLIGYARASSDEPDARIQIEQLRARGCQIVIEEPQRDQSRVRPALAKLMREIAAGDVLVVTRLDRIARSITHLLAFVEELSNRGAYFRSLEDPVDTSSPEGGHALEVLSAADRLQRAVIGERTRAAVSAAKSRGRLPGNPGLRERRPDAIRMVSEGRRRSFIEGLSASTADWLPIVERLRPQNSWADTTRLLNERGQNWTVEKLRRAVQRLAQEGMAKGELLNRSPRRAPEDRQTILVAGLANADPNASLRGIAAKLEQMRERAPRGGRRWSPSSVKALLDHAKRLGLVVVAPRDE